MATGIMVVVCIPLNTIKEWWKAGGVSGVVEPEGENKSEPGQMRLLSLGFLISFSKFVFTRRGVKYVIAWGNALA